MIIFVFKKFIKCKGVKKEVGFFSFFFREVDQYYGNVVFLFRMFIWDFSVQGLGWVEQRLLSWELNYVSCSFSFGDGFEFFFY